jgi:hypothetical protein
MRAVTNTVAPARVARASARANVARRSRRAIAVSPRANTAQVVAQTAIDLNEETVTAIGAAVLGLGAGLGIPIFFVWQERRDKERLEEIRELNRATLKATGEQMSPEEIAELRPSRYLDRREFKDDD